MKDDGNRNTIRFYTLNGLRFDRYQISEMIGYKHPFTLLTCPRSETFLDTPQHTGLSTTFYISLCIIRGMDNRPRLFLSCTPLAIYGMVRFCNLI